MLSVNYVTYDQSDVGKVLRDLATTHCAVFFLALLRLVISTKEFRTRSSGSCVSTHGALKQYAPDTPHA